VTSLIRNVPAYAWLLAALPALRVFGGNVERLSLWWLFLCLAVTFAIYFTGRLITRLLAGERELAEILWAIIYLCLIAAGYFIPSYCGQDCASLRPPSS